MNHYKRVLDQLIYREDLGPEDGELEVNAYAHPSLTWSVAEDYYVEGGLVRVRKTGDLREYDPLTDPDVLVSFLRLGRHQWAGSKRAEEEALAWVRRYGLPERKAESSHKKIINGEANQRPLNATEFVREAMEARHLALLYEDLRSGNFEKLIEDGAKLDEEEGRELTSAETFVKERWGKRRGQSARQISHTFLPLMTGFFVQQSLAEKLSTVRVTVSIGALLPDYANPLGGYSHPYSDLTYRWRDLKSAIYLHLALLMGNAKPIKRCENPNCRAPFPLERKDKRFCRPGCRSSGRAERRTRRS